MTDDVRPSGEEERLSTESAQQIIDYKGEINVALALEEMSSDLIQTMRDYQNGRIENEERIIEQLARTSVRIELLGHIHGVGDFRDERDEQLAKLQRRHADSGDSDD